MDPKRDEFLGNLLWEWDEERRQKHKAELRKNLRESEETAKGSGEDADRRV